MKKGNAAMLKTLTAEIPPQRPVYSPDGISVLTYTDNVSIELIDEIVSDGRLRRISLAKVKLTPYVARYLKESIADWEAQSK